MKKITTLLDMNPGYRSIIYSKKSKKKKINSHTTSSTEGKKKRSTKVMDDILKTIEEAPKPEASFLTMKLGLELMQGRMMRYLKRRYLR